MHLSSRYTINFDILNSWAEVDPNHPIYGYEYDAGGNEISIPHTLKYKAEYPACDRSRVIFDLMPGFISKNQFNISFDKAATPLISRLFEHYCSDNDTVIITSSWEHENVNEILKKYNNIQKIDIYSNDIENQVRQIDVLDKNVFVYIIGTQISSGIITRSVVFEDIRLTLSTMECKNITIVIDDVQGMFIVPRDYEFADYVIGTAHSLVSHYDLGFILYKKDRPNIGFNWDDQGMDYFKQISNFLDGYRCKLYQSQDIFRLVFGKLAEASNQHNVAPHVFLYTPRDMYGNLIDIPKSFVDSLEIIRVESRCENGSIVRFFRFRGQEVFNNKRVILASLSKIQKLINFTNEKYQ